MMEHMMALTLVMLSNQTMVTHLVHLMPHPMVMS